MQQRPPPQFIPGKDEIALLEPFERLGLSHIHLVATAAQAQAASEALRHHRVWGFDKEVNENNIEIYVHNLRKKLANTNVKIDTIRGVGYTLSKK